MDSHDGFMNHDRKIRRNINTNVISKHANGLLGKYDFESVCNNEAFYFNLSINITSIIAL